MDEVNVTKIRFGEEELSSVNEINDSIQNSPKIPKVDSNEKQSRRSRKVSGLRPLFQDLETNLELTILFLGTRAQETLFDRRSGPVRDPERSREKQTSYQHQESWSA